MKRRSTGQLLRRYWLVTAAIGVVLLLEGCGVMGLGHMGFGYPMAMERSGQGVKSVTEVSAEGIGVRLDVPPLRLEETSVLTVQVYDAKSGVPEPDVLVGVSIRWESASLMPDNSVLNSGSITLATIGSAESGSYLFLLTPREVGSYIIEATIYSSPYNKDEMVSLRMIGEVPDSRVYRRRRQWLTGVAIVGGVSMMAVMVLFMRDGHDHGS